MNNGLDLGTIREFADALLSVGSWHRAREAHVRGGGDAQVAVNAIVLATLANPAVKCGIVAALAGAVLRRPVIIATGAILVAASRRSAFYEFPQLQVRVFVATV